jgi:hypothetical protein
MMSEPPLPYGAEFVDGSIRMRATEQADQIAQGLLDRPFNQDEVTAIGGFFGGQLTLAETLSNHLHRLDNSEFHRLVIRIWMRSRFGSELSDAIETSFEHLEAEPDLTVLFLKLFHHLNGIRKESFELNVRRPPKIDRNRLNIAENKGTRVYKFDIDTKRASIEYPAVTSKEDVTLKQYTGRLTRTPGVPRSQTGSPVVEQFLLGMESLQSTVEKLNAIPTNKKIPAELKQAVTISSTIGASMIVGFGLNTVVAQRYVRRWMASMDGEMSHEDMFFELYERFSAVADIEEEQELSHATIGDLIQYGSEQVYPPDEGTSPFDSGKIAWQRYDADPVPDEDRQSIMEKTLSILRLAE